MEEKTRFVINYIFSHIHIKHTRAFILQRTKNTSMNLLKKQRETQEIREKGKLISKV